MRAAARTRFTLANGMRVLLHEDHRLPLVAVHVAYQVGAADEADDQHGLSHLYEHLMYGGSTNLPGSYLRQLSAIGAHDINGRSLLDSTHYFETVHRDALDFALQAEADRMSRLFTADSARVLELQREVVLNELRQYRERSEGQAFEALAGISYTPGHPYRHGIIGREADLQRITLDDVRAFGARHYCPGKAVLALAGDVDAEQARRLCEQYFGGLAAGDAAGAIARSFAAAPASRRVAMASVRAPSLYRVWNLPPPASQRELQMQAMLAGLIEARFSALRLQARYRYGRLGSQIEIGLEPADIAALDAVVTQLDREWRQLVDAGFSERELEAAQLLQQQAIAQRCDSRQGIAELMIEAELLGGDCSATDIPGLLLRLANDPHELQLHPSPVGAGLARDCAGGASVAGKARSYRGGADFFPAAAIAVPVLKSPAIEQHGSSLLVVRRPASELLAIHVIMPLEAPDQAGLAQLSATLLKPATDTIGVDISAEAMPDCIRYRWSATTQHSLAALQLLEAAMSQPAFDAAAFERAQRHRLATTARELGSAEGATERLLAAAAGTPIANVAALALDDLIAFQQRQNGKTICLMAGDTPPCSPGETRDLPIWPHAKSPGFTQATALIDIAGAEQTLVTVAWPLPACDRRQEAALQMLDALLAGRFASRLNLRLREELGWTYGVRSRLGAGAIARRYQIQVWVPAQRAADTRAEIIEAVECLIRDGIDKDAFRQLQRSESLRQLGSIERASNLASLMETRLRLGLLVGESWSGFEDVALLSAGDLQAAAVRCLPIAASLSVVAGDATRLRGLGYDVVSAG